VHSGKNNTKLAPARSAPNTRVSLDITDPVCSHLESRDSGLYVVNTDLIEMPFEGFHDVGPNLDDFVPAISDSKR
jgi:hypothetical protein